MSSSSARNPIFRFYNRYPNFAPLVAGVGLYGATDITATILERRYFAANSKHSNADLDFPFNPLRTLGVMTAAPLNNGTLVWFYRLADKLFGPLPAVGGRRLVLLQKVLFMQLCWTPLSIVGYVFCSTFFSLVYESMWRRCGYLSWLKVEEKEKLVREVEGALGFSTGEDEVVEFDVGGTDGREENGIIKQETKEESPALLQVLHNHNENIHSMPVESNRSNRIITQSNITQENLFLDSQFCATIAMHRVKSNFIEIYKTSFFVWPVSDSLNFTVIQRLFSPNFRATWDAGVGLIWNTYQSLITFRTKDNIGKIEMLG